MSAFTPAETAEYFVAEFYDKLFSDRERIPKMYRDDQTKVTTLVVTTINSGTTESNTYLGRKEVATYLEKQDHRNLYTKAEVICYNAVGFDGNVLIFTSGRFIPKENATSPVAPLSFNQTFLLESVSDAFYIRNDIVHFSSMSIATASTGTSSSTTTSGTNTVAASTSNASTTTSTEVPKKAQGQAPAQNQAQAQSHAIFEEHAEQSSEHAAAAQAQTQPATVSQQPRKDQGQRQSQQPTQQKQGRSQKQAPKQNSDANTNSNNNANGNTNPANTSSSPGGSKISYVEVAKRNNEVDDSAPVVSVTGNPTAAAAAAVAAAAAAASGVTNVNSRGQSHSTPVSNTPNASQSNSGAKVKSSHHHQDNFESRPRIFSVFVKDVPENATEQKLHTIFSEFGPVVGVNLKKGFGFIDFQSEVGVQKTIKNADMIKSNYKLHVEERRPKNNSAGGGSANHNTSGGNNNASGHNHGGHGHGHGGHSSSGNNSNNNTNNTNNTSNSNNNNSGISNKSGNSNSRMNGRSRQLNNATGNQNQRQSQQPQQTTQTPQAQPTAHTSQTPQDA